MSIPVGSSKQTIVEEGTEFKGTLASSCPIVVRGRIEGEIDTPALKISENGAVHGRAKVGALDSQGELSGEFDAETVQLAGRVKDNTVIRARSLEVKLASGDGRMQVIFGECELAVGDAPADDSLNRRGRAAKGKRDGRSESPPSPDETSASNAE
jgi:cytoskeletal protein CcmA (bactofilin family)